MAAGLVTEMENPFQLLSAPGRGLVCLRLSSVAGQTELFRFIGIRVRANKVAAPFIRLASGKASGSIPEPKIRR